MANSQQEASWARSLLSIYYPSIKPYMEFEKSHLYHYPLNQEHLSLLTAGVSDHFIQKNKVRMKIFFKFSMEICLYLYKYQKTEKKTYSRHKYIRQDCATTTGKLSDQLCWIVFILSAFTFNIMPSLIGILSKLNFTLISLSLYSIHSLMLLLDNLSSCKIPSSSYEMLVISLQVFVWDLDIESEILTVSV